MKHVCLMGPPKHQHQDHKIHKNNHDARTLSQIKGYSAFDVDTRPTSVLKRMTQQSD